MLFKCVQLDNKMVRVNLINPLNLADQHLIAEYLEIMMLIGHVKKYPEPKEVPENYTLGKGHIKFFKNKLSYLKSRHEDLKKEMKKRGFATNKSVNLDLFKKELLNDWSPSKEDIHIIKERIKWKISKKPTYYRYYGNKKDAKFLINLIDKA